MIRKPDLVEVVSMTEYSLSGLHNLLHRSKLLYSLPIEKVQYLYISPKGTELCRSLSRHRHLPVRIKQAGGPEGQLVCVLPGDG